MLFVPDMMVDWRELSMALESGTPIIECKTEARAARRTFVPPLCGNAPITCWQRVHLYVYFNVVRWDIYKRKFASSVLHMFRLSRFLGDTSISGSSFVQCRAPVFSHALCIQKPQWRKCSFRRSYKLGAIHGLGFSISRWAWFSTFLSFILFNTTTLASALTFQYLFPPELK